jgi:hypothetical protein
VFAHTSGGGAQLLFPGGGGNRVEAPEEIATPRREGRAVERNLMDEVESAKGG